MKPLKWKSLLSGVDDYVLKPFSVHELMARLRVAIRHATRVRVNDGHQNIFESNRLKVDLENRVITVRGKEIKLSPFEFKILALLARFGGKVITHNQILNEVWGPEHASDTHQLRGFIHQLRQKLETDPSKLPAYRLRKILHAYGDV